MRRGFTSLLSAGCSPGAEAIGGVVFPLRKVRAECPSCAGLPTCTGATGRVGAPCGLGGGNGRCIGNLDRPCPAPDPCRRRRRDAARRRGPRPLQVTGGRTV